MTPRKIIFCDNSLHQLLNFRGPVFRHFARQGADVLLVAPPTCRYTPELPNIRYIPVPLDRSDTNPMSNLAYFFRLRKIYRREKPDIVFHYTIKPNIWGTLAARLTGCRSVAMVAGLGYVFSGKGVGKKLVRRLYKFGLRHADRVLVLNRPNLEKLVDERFVHPDRAVLLPGGEGVDLSRFPHVENRFESVRFLMIARVLYDKGYSEYVAASEIVRRRYPELEFGLLGPLDDGPMGVPRGEVERDATAGKIVYYGETDDVPAYLSRDGVVLVLCSSYNEGLNRSLMEACAMGRPCITTDMPGCRETVDDGVNGYLVPKQNAGALADAILRFLALPQSEKRRMARESRRIAEERFDVEKAIAGYDRIIQSLQFAGSRRAQSRQSHGES